MGKFLANALECGFFRSLQQHLFCQVSGSVSCRGYILGGEEQQGATVRNNNKTK